MSQLVLDVCCGPKMMWFDKHDRRAIFGDIRAQESLCSDGRVVRVCPDAEWDFRALPVADETFWHIVFDPPHLNRLGAVVRRPRRSQVVHAAGRVQRHHRRHRIACELAQQMV